MSVDFAHTRTAQEQRAAKARTLARWCYDRGLIDSRILEADPKLRRQAARSASVVPPHEEPGQPGETWRLTVELLARKLEWDRAHGVASPTPARCVACAVFEDWCEQHQPRSCTVCGGQLHWVFLDEGSATHPSCDLLEKPSPAASAPTPVRAVEDTLY